MESPLSSPDRNPGPPICKVTYLERKKRKRTISRPDHSDSDSSANTRSITSSPMKSNTNSPKKNASSPKKSGSKVPASRGPKKVDVPLPGPSPIKRARQDSDESIKAPTVRKGMHIRSVSSISSLKQVAQNVADSPSAGKKPESSVSRKPKSKAKSVAASEDFDDDVSVADSAVTSKIRRNESERIEYYKNQPECGKAEPHSALCTKCNKPVNLGRKQTYAVRPWEIHRARCDQKPTSAVPATPKASESSIPASDPINIDPPSPILASTSQPTPARRLSESERKEFLEAEKQIEVVEKNRVSCKKCQKWIDLAPVNAYVTSNWVKHKIRCSDAVPSDRVAAAKRKLRVVNDTQVKSFSSRSIDCGFCGITVQLMGGGDFNLTHWEEHKLHCTKSVPMLRSDSVNSIAFPATSSRPPASSVSTEGTVVDHAVARPSKGLKRSREETDTIPEEDARPAVRPRKAGYLPPDMEPPTTVMGWFLLPFHSFVRGFKESLKDRN